MQTIRAASRGKALDKTDLLEPIEPSAYWTDATRRIVGLTEIVTELFAFLKVKNLKDAKESITGLRERVIFTQDYETLQFKLRNP